MLGRAVGEQMSGADSLSGSDHLSATAGSSLHLPGAAASTSLPSASGVAPGSERTLTGQPRKRAGLACLRCKKRKVKCDGRHPCHHCAAAMVECEFAPVTTKRGPKPGETKKKLQDRLAECERREAMLSAGQTCGTSVAGGGSSVDRSRYTAAFAERLTAIPSERLLMYAGTYFDGTNLFLPICSEACFYMRDFDVMNLNEDTCPASMPAETVLELAVLAMGARLSERPDDAETLFALAQAAVTAQFEAVHSLLVPALILCGYYSYCTNQLDFAVLYYSRSQVLSNQVHVDEMTDMCGKTLSGMGKVILGQGKSNFGKVYRRSVMVEQGRLEVDQIDVDQAHAADSAVEPTPEVLETIELCETLVYEDNWCWDDKHTDIVKFQMSLTPTQQSQLSDDPIAVSQDAATVGRALVEVFTIVSELSKALQHCDHQELHDNEPHLRSRLHFAELLFTTFRPGGPHCNSLQVLIYSLRSLLYRRLGCETLALEGADQTLSSAIANTSYKSWCPYFHFLLQYVALTFKEAGQTEKYKKTQCILATILPKFAPVRQSSTGHLPKDPSAPPPRDHPDLGSDMDLGGAAF